MNEAEPKGRSEDAQNDAVIADQTSAEKTTAPQLLADARSQANHQNSKTPRPFREDLDHFFHVTQAEVGEAGYVEEFAEQIVSNVGQQHQGREAGQRQECVRKGWTAQRQLTFPIPTDNKTNDQPRKANDQ